MAHDVFISYSSKDKTIANAVCATLEKHEIRCWIAPRDVPPGLQYAAALISAINDCKVFVLVFSKGSNASGQVLREVEEAVDNGTPIIPLRIEDFEPTEAMRYYIKSLHWLDAMTPPLEQHLGKLVASVQALLSIGVEEQPAPVAEIEIEAPVKKRWPLPTWATGLLALAAVVIVGGVGWLAISQLRSTPTPSPVPSTPVSIIPELTDTPVPDVPTTTSIAVTSIIFRDDFDNALSEGWNIVREDSSHWSLTDKPGSWRITLQAGAIGDAIPQPPSNLLLREAPSGDFEITTLIHFTPVSNVQFAGLIVYQDDLNAVQFGRAYCDLSEMCVGNGIYFDNTSDISKNHAAVTSNPSIAYLRLRREGTTYTGYYSEDGGSWTIIGQHISNINPLQVGLTAGQVLEAETTADFEYFTMETLPSQSPGENDWRLLSFMIPNPQIWEESGDNRYTAVGQSSVDAFAWSKETFDGDLILSLELESPVNQSEGCVIIYGNGLEHSYGSLIFCVESDFYQLEKHTRYHEGENFLAFSPSNIEFKDKAYSVTIEIIDDVASMYVDGVKVISSFFDMDEFDRNGRIGLYKVWEGPEITFSNIQIRKPSDVDQNTSAAMVEGLRCQFDHGSQLAFYPIESPFNSHPVQVDGAISSDDEWSDAMCVDLRMHYSVYYDNPNTQRVRWWVQNNEQEIFFLVRIPKKLTMIGVFIGYFWPEFTGTWAHSDGVFVTIDGEVFDYSNWDESQFYEDEDLDPPGTMDVQAAQSEDGEFYWFEIRKPLDSGDRYDWAFEPGQRIGDNPYDSFTVGVELEEGPFFRNLQLDLGEP